MPSPAPANSESLTRKRIIDGKLRAAGWEILPYKKVNKLSTCTSVAIEEFETANGPADYALYRNGRILGVVEAKKLSLGHLASRCMSAGDALLAREQGELPAAARYSRHWIASKYTGGKTAGAPEPYEIYATGIEQRGCSQPRSCGNAHGAGLAVSSAKPPQQLRDSGRLR